MYLKLSLILIKYKLYIYDVIGSTTVRSSIRLVNREPIIFLVQCPVRF